MLLTSVGIAFVLPFFGQNVAAIQVWDSLDDIPTAVPSDCRNALTYNMTCANSLVTAQDAANGAALVGVAAKTYCTKECHDSLQTFQESILSACGKKEYQLYKNSTTTQSPAVVADGLVWAYSLMCIQDASGYCLADLYNRTKAPCSDCTLKYGSIMMSSDYGRNKFPPAAFSSLLSSCSVPASSYPYTYTPLPTATTMVSTPTGATSTTATPTCTGHTYISIEGDTCKSISKANSVSTDQLIKVNKLDYSCSMLISGTPLCIQDTCTVFTVQQNQTCNDIIKAQSFGLVQLIGWNPPPGGGEFSLPDSTNKTSAGLPSSLITSWVPGTPVTTMDNITTSWYSPIIDPNYTPSIPTFTPNATLSSLLAERTKYCWITAEDENNGFIPEDDLSDNCYSLYESYCDLGPTDPVPSPSPSAIPTSCTPTSSSASTTDSSPATTTTSGIATPTPTQPNMTKDCTKFHKVVDGDNCATISKEYGISQADFLTWNPDVGADCKNLWLDNYVCVGSTPTSTSGTPPPTSTSPGVVTPTPTQPNMTKGCTKFHMVVDGDNCATISREYGISRADFLTWNPDVGTNCTNLWLDNYVCVEASPSSNPSPTTTLSPSPTSEATPTPTLPKMVDGCIQFHKVEDGDICASIATQYGISQADFLAWNPYVGDGCKNLWLGYYVCVGKQ
ncbi:hypothetical protein DTO013E5_8367 [Penicillium roqueforti]|nr:hypothetical protein CBS147354_9502 [Penicillium roqueforti]KAI2740888.1 hypothetical protein DTO013F2_8993 [Penicillium roqueforti]KAI2743441.1 hypothetical protein DTO012A1_3355 [Penicillium roqueforti]KAI2767112.1 hypothetical protein DTO012A8_7661 [Penicillium roqueforti]KAI3070035.1 hypothetical protein CBS147339_7548 [Penicillium roqueforti]